MKRAPSRSGFTLVEMMVAGAILVIVLGALFSSFVGGIRLLKATFATAEMSLRARELREHLLFQAARRPQDGTSLAGLLSGTNSTDVLEGNATKLLMYCTALRSTGGATSNQTIQLTFEDYGTSTCHFFSADPEDTWLRPGGMNLMADSAATPPFAWARKADDSEDHSRFYIYLTGEMDIAGLPVKHRERIVVPVSGHQQETRLDGKGGLDK